MSRERGKPCPIKGCTAHAKPGQLMCLPHWRRVPKALNRAVFDTYRNLRNDVEAYRQARDAAIAAVEAKEAEERAAIECLLKQSEERARRIDSGACEGCEAMDCPGGSNCWVPF